jgi:acyl-coenzyme A thioesterase PaaI-like protein
MHVTELALNHTLGMQLTPEASAHILELPETPLLLNHVGTVHASVQFALAEAGSGEFLLRHLGAAQHQFFAVLRTSAVKFRKPAHGTLRATARFAEGVADSLTADLTARGRALAAILVEVTDAQGVVTMTGQYDWFLQRLDQAT